MIKNIFLSVIVSFLMISCGASKNISPYNKQKEVVKVVTKTTTNNNTTKTTTKATTKPTIADKIVWTAVTYKGAPYKFGGMSKRGMDCSGLIYTSFTKRKVKIPRTSREMFVKGHNISLQKVKRGDLLFFGTSRRKGKVNHVGLVTSINKGDIRFIHSTSSRGVIVTSLRTDYWRKSFIVAKRIL